MIDGYLALFGRKINMAYDLFLNMSLLTLLQPAMFDMLDDDLDIEYVPTVMSNSRSGNMKKITKKQPKAAPKQPPAKVNSTKNNEYDDLLDDLMDFDHKKPAKKQENKSATPRVNLYNSLDSQNDEPKPASVEKAKPTLKQPAPSIISNTSKTSFLKLEQTDQIIHEDHNISSFGKIAPPTNNSTIKAEEPFVSTRNMKPPIIRKKNETSESMSFGMGSIGLTIPQQAKSKNLSLNNEDDEIIRPPPRLMNRRSSADAKNQEPLSIPKNNRSQSPINNFSLDVKREDPPKQREQLRLSLDQPKIQPRFTAKAEQVNSFKAKFAEKQKQKEVKPLIVEAPKQQKPMIKEQRAKKGLDMHIDQSITILKESPTPSVPHSNKIANQDYQRQIEQLKMTFQKQVDFIQENLDRQISINRETRDKLMREANKMIEDQRERTKRIQEEEIRRLKEMFQWEKKRMEESFQSEINNLRQSLEYAQKTNNNSFKTPTSSREDMEYLESQLRYQKKLIQDRQKILQKRELELTERQNEQTKRRKRQQERLRQQQKRILENQMKTKKQLIQQKRLIAEQKQQMAIELANLEIQAMKKRQKAECNIKEYRIERQGLQNEKFELRNQNAQLMARYKVKVEQVQNEKVRLKNIQADLIKKLRIVQQKMKQTNTSTVNKTMYAKKQNNWIEDKDISQPHLRSFSIEKHEISKKPPIGNQTKDRFYQLESNTKNKMNISVKENKKFDLDNYMMTVQEYKKLRGEA